MATELMARLVNGYGKEAERKVKVKVDKDPITRDLLGGCPVMDMVMDAKDLDLALAVGSASASASSRDKPHDRHNTNISTLPGQMFLSSNGNPLQNQDLNLPPTAISLQIPHSSPRTSYVAAAAAAAVAASNINYQSVCTIEKVKFALERMGRESQTQSKSHAPSEGSPSPSSSSITSNSPIKRPIDAVVDGSCDSSVASVGGGSSNSMMAAACPKCLLYVLISKENPRCPQCNSHVPPAVLSKNNNSNKKPRINLNSTTLDLF